MDQAYSTASETDTRHWLKEYFMCTDARQHTDSDIQVSK